MAVHPIVERETETHCSRESAMMLFVEAEDSRSERILDEGEERDGRLRQWWGDDLSDEHHQQTRR